MSAVSENRPYQIKDYITQILSFSNKDGLPKIIQVTVGNILDVSGSTVSRFLITPSNGKLSRNFESKFSQEVLSWPPNSITIEKALKKADVVFFLNIIAPINLKLKPAPQVNQLTYPPTFMQGARTTAPNLPNKPNPLPRAEIKVRQHSPLSQAPIVISYRGHQDAKDGQGMLYDHMCFQISTRHPTVRSQPLSVNEQVTSMFTSAISQNPASLPEGIQNREGKKVPTIIQDSTDGGLLVIPGRIRKIENEPIRFEHEKRIIREALKRGQPILAVCAGAWRVWEQVIGNEVQAANALINVEDHNYGGGMLRLDKTGIYATYNVQIHDVTIENASLLESSMRVNNAVMVNRLSVNSVHWKAVNPNTCPAHFRISAWSHENPSFQRTTRQQEEMHPQENTPEAFESTIGAPILGIQWHPEGYTARDKDNHDLHINLLCYMAKAGDAYQAKCRVLQELLTKTNA